jgi:hypothetical protein
MEYRQIMVACQETAQVITAFPRQTVVALEEFKDTDSNFYHLVTIFRGLLANQSYASTKTRMSVRVYIAAAIALKVTDGERHKFTPGVFLQKQRVIDGHFKQWMSNTVAEEAQQLNLPVKNKQNKSKKGVSENK